MPGEDHFASGCTFSHEQLREKSTRYQNGQRQRELTLSQLSMQLIISSDNIIIYIYVYLNISINTYIYNNYIYRYHVATFAASTKWFPGPGGGDVAVAWPQSRISSHQGRGVLRFFKS